MIRFPGDLLRSASTGASQAPLFTVRRRIAISISSTHSRDFRVAIEGSVDNRFKDTSQEAVARLIGDTHNVEFRKGYFPDTAVGLEAEKFASVMLDVDLYRPASGVFRFFILGWCAAVISLCTTSIHLSQTTPSSCCTRIMNDKPELLIEIPDFSGSALFRKLS